MYKICICDDDVNVLNHLKDILLRYQFINDIEIDTLLIKNAYKLIDIEATYDILFLDIRFDNKNIGIDIAERLRENGNNSVIVLITSFESLSLDGYRAEPFRFIVKPFTETQIFRLMDVCIDKLHRLYKYIKLTTKFQTEFIRSDKIIYIVSKNRKRFVYCLNNNHIITWQSLSDIMQQLPSSFCFVHKSYIVNMDHVDHVSNNIIYTKNNSKIAIGGSYKRNFIEKLLKSMKEK